MLTESKMLLFVKDFLKYIAIIMHCKFLVVKKTWYGLYLTLQLY